VSWAFSHTDEVRFSDLDINGHLNNVAFLEFIESARVAYIGRAYPQGEGWRTSFGILIAETKIAYRSPGHFGERIETFLRPDDVGRTSFRTDFEMRVGERVLADGYSVMVIFDRDERRPAPIPPELRAQLLADGAGERAAQGFTKL
jgi:acyl-CoA thioester hydrolase